MKVKCNNLNYLTFIFLHVFVIAKMLDQEFYSYLTVFCFTQTIVLSAFIQDFKGGKHE